MNKYFVGTIVADGNLLGEVILIPGQTAIVGTHYYRPYEKEALRDRLQELDNEQAILQYWPSFDDPQVQRLLRDETFEPLEMEWVDAPVTGPDGKLVEAPDSDHDPDRPWEAKLVTERKQVPKEPSAVTARIKTAQEMVARARANLDRGGESLV